MPGWCSAKSAQRPRATRSRPFPELLDALELRGTTVTIDAVGCQRAIVEKIIEKKADYLIAVKNNQPTLAQEVESLFADVEAGVRDGRLQQDTTLDKAHGRIETRQCVVAHDVSALAEAGSTGRACAAP